MPVLYELLVLGNTSNKQVAEIKQLISQALKPFLFQLGREVAWVINPSELKLDSQKATAVVFFGGKNASTVHLQSLLQNNIPILPVVSQSIKVQEEIPAVLSSLNCLSYSEGGAQRVATALLECVGLLPRQRRVFVSYRRNEARQAALQLFDELSSRLFDVFLDTHKISPSEDFQAMLWHRLCDSDVLIMLDTPNYFESRWTTAEFGRALAKGFSILRVVWPNISSSKRTVLLKKVELLEKDINPNSGLLSNNAIDQICSKLEVVRSKSIAIRNLNLAERIRYAIEQIGGTIVGVGMNKTIYIRLADGTNVVVYPNIHAPNSKFLHNAIKNSPNSSVAIVFDHIGLHPDWLEHLEWLGSQIQSARWVKAAEVAWQFADWEV